MIIDVKDLDSPEMAKYGFGTHKVLVDGVEYEDVFFVDTDAGIVKFYARDQHGNHYLVHNGEVATGFVKGKVELVREAVLA